MTHLLRLTICLVLLLPLSAIRAESGPGLYSPAGEFSFQGASSVTAKDNFLYILFANSVGVVDLNSPGLKAPLLNSTILNDEYQEMQRAGNWLYLFAGGGRLAILRIYGDRLIKLAETVVDDSVLSVAAGGRYLYLAAGFAGVKIVDAGSRRHPREIGVADHGAYYSEVLIAEEQLYAVDAFNGVDVYSIIGETLVYGQTLLTDRPPIGLAVTQETLFAWFGDSTISGFALNGADSEAPATEYNLAHDVSQLLASGEWRLIASRQGLVTLYSTSFAELIDSLRLPYPVAELRLVSESARESIVAATDVLGGVRLLRLSDGQLTAERSVDLVSQPLAAVGFEQKLLAAAAAGGIAGYRHSGDRLTRSLDVSSGLVYTALAVTDSILFAAADGQDLVNVYDLTAPTAALIASFPKSLPARKLLAWQNVDHGIRLVTIGPAGAECFSFSTSTFASQLLWQIESESSVVTGFSTRTLIGLLSANDTLSLFALSDEFPPLIATLPLPESTRAILPFADDVLVYGGKAPLAVSRLAEPYNQLELLREYTTVTDLFDLAYDSSAGILIAACGAAGIKYFDFSNPEVSAAVYPIIGSGRVSRLALGRNHLYALSQRAIAAYRYLDPAGPVATPPQRFIVSYNYPNPFNSATRIDITAADGQIINHTLIFEVYNILGQLVRSRELSARSSRVQLTWDGTDSSGSKVASGLYFLRVRVDRLDLVRKALLLK